MSKLFRTIGPPGCGKTTWLARQCLNAAQKYGGESIAIASLTRTAAAEIASRSTGVPRANIGTLHSHAFRRLGLTREQVAETSLGIKEWNEQCKTPAWKLSKRSVANPENAGPDDTGYGDDGDNVLAEIGVLRARCVDTSIWPLRLQGFHKAWTTWKSSSGRVDFTDMVEKATEEVDDLGVSIVMLDEAQDMSLLEMRLARKWGNAAEQLLVVGDPDQTIYEWRGSDPSAFYEGEATLTQTLAQSYRVPQLVHKKAVEWIEQIPEREPVEYYPRAEAGSITRHHQACWRDADGLASLCEGLADDGSTVAVLASCGYMVAPLAATFKARAVPFAHPYRPERWEWNPLNNERLLCFMTPKLQGRLWTWDELWKWISPLQAKGVLERGAKVWFEAKAKTKGWKFETSEDRIVTELSTVLDKFLPEHQHAVFNCDFDWWRSHLKHTDGNRQKYVCEVARRHGFNALLQRPRLSLGTIHSYKGGEADKVVLIPDMSRAGAEQWFGHGKDAIVRLFYVGITRARSELHVVGSAGTDFVTI